MKIQDQVKALEALGCLVVLWEPEKLTGMDSEQLIAVDKAAKIAGNYVMAAFDENNDEDEEAGRYWEDNECPNCNGTGEGAYEGSVCHCCGGSGNGPIQHDPDDFDIPDEDY